jgi:hypothetical protein
MKMPDVLIPVPTGAIGGCTTEIISLVRCCVAFETSRVATRTSTHRLLCDHQQLQTAPALQSWL